MRSRYAPLLRTVTRRGLKPKDTKQIVGQRKSHNAKENYQPELTEPQSQCQRHGFPPHPFNKEKHELASVEYWDGQKVQNSQIH